MIRKRYLAFAFIAAASVFAQAQASALSVNAFEQQNAKEQVASYDAIVKDAILEAYKINQQTSAAAEDYFTKIPPGAQLPKGYTAFDAELQQSLQDGKAGKLDLDKVQIEDLVFDVFQTQVMPNVARQQPAPAAPVGPQVTKS